MRRRLKRSSMPGKTVSSSVVMSLIALAVNRSVKYFWITPQPSSTSWTVSISCAHRLALISTGSLDSFMSNESPRLWAGSVLTTSVFLPCFALLTAVAAAMLVFPTPPFPVYSMIRIVYPSKSKLFHYKNTSSYEVSGK